MNNAFVFSNFSPVGTERRLEGRLKVGNAVVAVGRGVSAELLGHLDLACLGAVNLVRFGH